ncbi:peptidase M24 [Halovivax asiaticus JCM 14624]|uniref:Peptidase M24 n=1 Tax=Halovivax asiaticus JCM 14624 TaxID=1227490 RepID=M0BQH4_9EURY|nr:Xaa-Pro peptidase family protein [Halovivax asiaticus]ELZ12603.1 peptidase M24 [Halovivax asiaticus JCM 14624]
MPSELAALRSALATTGVDGYLIDAAGDEPEQRYVSGFSAPDPFQTLVTDDGVHLLVSGLEFGRAQSEADADSVTNTAAYDAQDLRDEYGPREGRLRTIEAFLADHDVASIAVPQHCPIGTADGLRDLGVDVTVEADDVVGEIRATKSGAEIDAIHETQAANQRAMSVAEGLIAAAEVRDGVLYHEDEPLTSERVTTEIEIALLREGCALDETIVACGADAADPHDRGSGPLEAGESIVIDIFPRDKETGYFGDMTRTFVRGEPSDELSQRYDVTYEAFEAALDAIEPGVTGDEVHGIVCDVIEDAGYATLRSDPETDTGYIHGTGHGVGLDIHEGPRLSFGGEELEPGHVVTVEPGIYDPAVGGVRIEDLVVVTEDGYENLTDYPIAIEPEDRR